MLSLFFGQKLCKPGKGLVKSLQYWQAVPQSDYAGTGKEQVDRFLRNVDVQGLEQQWAYKLGLKDGAQLLFGLLQSGEPRQDGCCG